MSKFRTTELSDPDFESDGLRFITVKTTNLKGRGDICVFVPAEVNGLTDVPIVILLHGVYGSAWIWAMKGGAHKVAQTLIDDKKIEPMILVMPSDGLWGDGSAYLPHNSKDFEKWIADDVPNAVIENIPEVSSNSVRFIGGLSMGGFGAMRIGAKYGSAFRGISAHSSITSIEQMSLFVEEPIEAYYQADKVNEDLYQTIIKADYVPPLRFDCGLNDLLIDYNRKLHNQLSSELFEHFYEEFEGEHNWEYWNEHIKDSLKFFNSQLISQS